MDRATGTAPVYSNKREDAVDGSHSHPLMGTPFTLNVVSARHGLNRTIPPGRLEKEILAPALTGALHDHGVIDIFGRAHARRREKENISVL